MHNIQQTLHEYDALVPLVMKIYYLLQHMIHKHISISVIAAVVAAGILTLSILASTSSTNQAFGQFTPTSLSLSAFPNNGKVGSAGTLRVSLSGKLTSEMPEVSQVGKSPPLFSCLELLYLSLEQATVKNILSQLMNWLTITRMST